MAIPEQIQAAIDEGALFLINHSGGKDSQAMTAFVRSIVPASQIYIVHAHLPGVEWEGVIEHIRENIGDLPLEVCQAKKTFLEMVEHRQMWPGAQYRQCTSDLKRGPIQKVMRRLAKEGGYTKVVNCMGMRAQESRSRARQPEIKINKSASCRGREVIDWLPIHRLHVLQVLGLIAENGQMVHWAYQEGMSRLSCCFCILANRSDLRIAAGLNPALYKTYLETERRIGHTLRHGQTLDQVIAD